MTDRSIRDIKIVKIIGEGDVDRGRRVNDFLANGWVLLHVYSKGVASDNPPSQQAMYVIGWEGSEHPDLNAILTTSGYVCMRDDTGFVLGKVDDIGPIQAESEPTEITEALTGWLVLALGNFDRNPTAGLIAGMGMRKDEEENIWIVFSNRLPGLDFSRNRDE